ncbi:MAG: SCO family protein [Thermoanaerobaculia bacterium]|nr:SCO family protein [Thermoanaerobaculia bacterium]
MKRALLVLAVLASAGAACRKPPEPAAPKAAVSPGLEKPYPLKGVVVSVDRAGGKVTLKHEAVPGYMDAMTMPFAVGAAKILDDLKPGDTVEAKLLVGDRSSHLEGIVVSRPPGTTALETIPAQGRHGKPGDAAPATALVDQEGKAFSLATHKGEAVGVTFIFTRCPLPDFCPRMNLNFSEVERLLAADPKLYARTRLLSVSFDPAYDTPAVLKAFRDPFLRGVPGVAPGHWRFATGTLEHIKEFAGFFGLTYLKTGEQFVHSLATAVIAPDGTVYSIRRGNDWEAKELVEDLRKAAAGEKPK